MGSSELFESCSADGCSLTTSSSRGVTGLNMFTLTEAETFEFTRMNSAAMVSSGGCCDPSADSALLGNECKCEPSVDVIHGTPRDLIGSQRVDHRDAFIANNEFGSDKNQISSKHEEKRPKGCSSSAFEVSSEPGLNCQCCTDEQHNREIDVSATRSENLFISHKPIIAGVK